MTMRRRFPKYCHPWVDKKTGLAYCYLRRRGFPLVRLPGLPWLSSFTAAYEAALTGPRTAIGAGRSKPGGVRLRGRRVQPLTSPAIHQPDNATCHHRQRRIGTDHTSVPHWHQHRIRALGLDSMAQRRACAILPEKPRSRAGGTARHRSAGNQKNQYGERWRKTSRYTGQTACFCKSTK